MECCLIELDNEFLKVRLMCCTEWLDMCSVCVISNQMVQHLQRECMFRRGIVSLECEATFLIDLVNKS